MIINLTKQPATPQQVAMGVQDPPEHEELENVLYPNEHILATLGDAATNVLITRAEWIIEHYVHPRLQEALHEIWPSLSGEELLLLAPHAKHDVSVLLNAAPYLIPFIQEQLMDLGVPVLYQLGDPATDELGFLKI